MRVVPSDFVVGMLLGAALLGGGLLLGGAGDDDDATRDVVRARRFEVVDEIGTVRLVVGDNEAGGTISIRDRLGRTILITGASDRGPVVVLSNPGSTRPAVTITAGADGGSLQLLDTAGRRVLEGRATDRGGRLTIATTVEPVTRPDASPAGGPGGRPVRSDSRIAVRLEVDPGGTGILSTYAPDGHPAASMFCDAAGGGVIEGYGAAGHATVTLSSTATGHGQFVTSAPNDRPLVLLTATAENEGQFYTFDADTGRPLAAIATRAGAPALRLYNSDGNPAITLELDEEDSGNIGVWKIDATGRTLKP